MEKRQHHQQKMVLFGSVISIRNDNLYVFLTVLPRCSKKDDRCEYFKWEMKSL